MEAVMKKMVEEEKKIKREAEKEAERKKKEVEKQIEGKKELLFLHVFFFAPRSKRGILMQKRNSVNFLTIFCRKEKVDGSKIKVRNGRCKKTKTKTFGPRNGRYKTFPAFSIGFLFFVKISGYCLQNSASLFYRDFF